jgi:hypothetical protein
MDAEDGAGVEGILRHIDDLAAALSHIPDPTAREMARELVEAVLDLHGLAMARIMTMAAAAEGGRALIQSFAEDAQVRALLLLYGLHPDNAETRVRRALEELRPRLADAGIEVGLTRIVAGTAWLRVSGAVLHAGALRHDIEKAAVDAAPDLDEIVIEGLDGSEAAAAPSFAR